MADGDDKRAIAGSGGGKSGGQRKPVEAPDTLHSIASAQVLDLVSEGPIVGFATENPLESVYLDETPIANPDGSLNFKDVQFEYRYGTQDQEYIKGFPSVENEILAGVELRQSTPYVRSITNLSLSAIRIRMAVPGLSKVDEETNDVIGHRIGYAIDIASEIGGAYENVLTTAFHGKTTSNYERSHRIDLPESDTGWMLRVRRLTANEDSAVIRDTTNIVAVTEIVDAKLRYPNSALVGTKVNAEQFPSIPRRAFDLVGRIVRVPSNYDPIARTYDGIWDGTFKPEWTDNPAWIYYDAVIHPRYGLGHRVSEDQIDRWALYRIAQICDQLVPDGKGGLEPRYTCNIFIQQRVGAYRLLQDLTSVFNGISYYADNRVVAAIDAPSDPAVDYTNADVIGGRFTYSGSGKATRATVALVTWYDPDDFHRPKIEPVVDDAGVARYGIEQIELLATGCTSQGQAQRAGWWALLTGRLETEAVSFSLSLDGTFAMPGQIIRVADAKRAGRRIGGRVSSATINTVTVDELPEVVPTAGDRVSAMLPSGLVEQRTITDVDEATKTLSTVAFTAVPVSGGAWIVETTDLAPQLFRVISVTEGAGSEGDGTEGMTFDVSAVEHVPEKFAAIDGGVLIEGPPITQLPSTVQPAPASVTLSAVERAGHVVASPMLAVEWPQTAGAVRYGVAYRRADGDWLDMPPTTATRVEIENVFKGTYLAQVWAYNAAGVVSGRTTSEPFVFDDQTLLPGVIEDHDGRLEYTEQQLVDQQAAIDQEVADRIEEINRVAQEAAQDATDKANAARDTALAASAAVSARVDGLVAEIGEIVNAPEWDGDEDYITGWLVQEDGGLYRALEPNTGLRPSENPGTWEYLGQFASVAEAAAAALSMAQTAVDEIAAEASRIDALFSRMPTEDGTLATQAAVVAEAQTRATEIAAEADRIDGILARMPSGIGELATEASVSDLAAAFADETSALATRVSSMETRMPSGEGVLATIATVSANETASVARDEALGERITTIRASTGQTVLLNNPDFELEELGWQASAFTVDDPEAPLPPNVDILRTAGGLAHTGNCALRVAPRGDGAATFVFNSNRFSVGPGDVISGSIRLRTHYESPPPAGTRVIFGVRWFDADNSGLPGLVPLAEMTFNGSQNYFYGNDPLAGDVEAPTGAAYGRFGIHVSSQFDGAPGPIYFDAAQGQRGGTNATLAQLTSVETASTTRDTALGERIDLTEAAIEDKADASVVQQVVAEVNTLDGNVSAIAGTVDGLTSTVGGHTSSINELREVSVSSAAGNAIVNASFENTGEGRGWGTISVGTGPLTGYYWATGAARSGGHVFRFNAETTLNNAGLMAVPASRQIRVGFWSRHVGGTAPDSYIRFTVRGYDAQMNQVLFTAIGGTATRAGGGTYSTSWQKNERVYTVPSDVVFIRGVLQTTTGDWSGNWMVDDVFMEAVNESDATAMARHSVLLDVNGNVSGTVSENDGSRSVFSILANVFRVITSGNTGLEWQNGYLRAYAGAVQLIFGINFGASNNLCFWYGPNVGANNCTKSNATIWFDNAGSAYFGGTLSAGVLRNGAQSTQISNRASVTTGVFNTNGKQKVVTFSLSHVNSGIVYPPEAPPGAQSLSATVRLERRRGGTGSWTNLSTLTATGAITQIPEGSATSVYVSVSGSSTYTDNATGTADFEYRVRIINSSGLWPWINPLGSQGTQTLTVLSIEEP